MSYNARSSLLPKRSKHDKIKRKPKLQFIFRHHRWRGAHTNKFKLVKLFRKLRTQRVIQ
eukprot:UN00608